MHFYNSEHSVFRSRKALLKLQIAEIDPLDGSEKNVGSCLFDLKEAIPCMKPLDNPDESYIMVSYVVFLIASLCSSRCIFPFEFFCDCW